MGKVEIALPLGIRVCVAADQRHHGPSAMIATAMILLYVRMTIACRTLSWLSLDGLPAHHALQPGGLPTACRLDKQYHCNKLYCTYVAAATAKALPKFLCTLTENHLPVAHLQRRARPSTL